jgi:hypothetical protein
VRGLLGVVVAVAVGGMWVGRALAR